MGQLGGAKCLYSGEGITVARRGKKPTVKMIFIDWAIAAAVRLHYELKAQIRAQRCLREPIKWSARKQGSSWGSSWQIGWRKPATLLVFEHKPSRRCFFVDEAVDSLSIAKHLSSLFVSTPPISEVRQ